jgi:hypothetical protein
MAPKRGGNTLAKLFRRRATYIAQMVQNIVLCHYAKA